MAKTELGTTQRINADVLVIGSGAAGLRAAIAARKYGLNVMLISESPAGFRNNTAISQATFAATGLWKEPGDSPEAHLKDIIAAGRFINDQRLVTTMTRTVRQQVYDLIEFGVNFRRSDGELLVGQMPGHTYPRHVTAEAYKGINISRPMRQYAASIGIQFIEGILVTKLLRAGDTIVGALGIGGKGQVFVVSAKSTILATGGAGEIYPKR
ncbi:Fumarate reductase flavoprotein subunit [subsurface metagenome]